MEQPSDIILPNGAPLLKERPCAECVNSIALTLEPVDLLLQLLDRPLGELGAGLGLNSGKNENEILAEIQ